VVARELLTETGSVFVQIGDENVHLVRGVLDEVFGSENFSGQIVFFKTSSQSTVGIPSIVDYLILYAKNKDHQKLRPILRLKEPGERGAKQYVFVISPDMQTMRRMTDDEINGREAIPQGWKICRPGPTTSQGYQENRSSGYQFQGETFYPSAGRHWSYDPNPGKEMDRLSKLGRLRKAGKGIATVLLADDNPSTELDNVWLDTGTGSFTEEQMYVVQTGIKVVERCLLMTTDPGDLVLDPTCGSGTTAYVAEQWVRRWITIDTSRVALALARTRLMAAKFPYYLLADSPEGIKKEAELTGKFPPPHPTENDIRKGFVYKRVPHVTLKSIANNPDIKEGMTRKQIDEAIARHADTETLFDQPYEDSKTLRVTGPFTVESLSPHRVLATEAEKQDRNESTDFAGMILENLRKAGVQNTKKGERLKFDTLDAFAGSWLHATGTYT
jgi:adenine-specific DNA-methyltransferase